jgi:hypothetical protein
VTKTLLLSAPISSAFCVRIYVMCVCERIQICAPFIGNWFGIAADGSRVIVRGPRINKNTENQPISSRILLYFELELWVLLVSSTVIKFESVVLLKTLFAADDLGHFADWTFPDCDAPE